MWIVPIKQLGKLSLNQIVDKLLAFDGKLIIQTLFIRGSYKGETIDNTTKEEVGAWLSLIKKVNPEYVMIYPIDRDTPARDLVKISNAELNAIAARVEAEGIKTEVYY